MAEERDDDVGTPEDSSKQQPPSGQQSQQSESGQQGQQGQPAGGSGSPETMGSQIAMLSRGMFFS